MPKYIVSASYVAWLEYVNLSNEKKFGPKS